VGAGRQKTLPIRAGPPHNFSRGKVSLEDDPHTDRLREQIRDELGTKPVDRRRAGPFGQFFVWICIATPFAAYAFAIYYSHDFHSMSELWNWAGECFRTKCPK
jgi:hypothetical protein